MSEPQARSTLGTCWRTLCAPLPNLITVVVALAVAGAPAAAQIRGRAPTQRSTSSWWLSGGAGATTLTDINDGASRSTWKFGSDPLWQYRGSLERGLDDFTTIGVAASFGRVNFTVLPLAGAPTTTSSTPLPAACAVSCSAQAQLWSLMGQFRSGGGTGFHTTVEITGGVTGVREMRTRDSLAVAIGKSSGTIDMSGALGAGFAFPLTRRMVIALVQDFGIGMHAKTDLPSGVSRTWRIRTTRASLRFQF